MKLEWPHDVVKRRWMLLAAIKDCLDDVGRQQRHLQYPADVGRVDLLGRGQLLNGAVGAGLQQFAPPECAGERLDHRVIP